jgi:capsid assembly protease
MAAYSQGGGTVKRFTPVGPAAILATAWGMEFGFVPPPPYVLEGNVASVMIVGPLTHHWGMFGVDTYDAIEARVSAALDSPADVVVLKLDSPGGEAEGAFECGKTLRAMAASKGKQLIAYVDECAASAAYAIACAASAIYLPASARVGSIGVIQCAFDETARNAKEGVNVAVITSGKHKSDGNPHVQFTPEAQAEMQRAVDGLALQFFGHVAAARSIAPEQVKALEAAMLTGYEAVNAGLADGVMSWSELLAMVASKEPSAQAAAGAQESAMTRSEFLAALKAALAEDAPAEPDKDKEDMSPAEFKAALRGMLAEDEPPPAEPEPKQEDEEPPAEEAKAKARAESDDPVKQALAIAQEAKAEAAQLRSELKAKDEAAQRKALLDARTDLDAKVRAVLESKPLAYVRETLDLIPRSAVAPAAAAQAQPTRGEGQTGDGNSRSPQLPPDEAKALRIRMGLDVGGPQVVREGNQLVMSAIGGRGSK